MKRDARQWMELVKMENFRVGFFMLHPNIWFGGGQIALLRVAGWLSGKGLPTEIIVSRIEGKLPFQPPKGVRVVNLNVPALKAAGKVIGTSVAISAVFGLARYFRQNPRQLVIAPGWADGGLALWAKKLAKSGAKVAIWEQTHVSAMKSQGGNLYRQLAPQIVKLSYRHADVVAACSSAVADDIAKLSKLPRERVHVIYNPTDPDIEAKAQEPVDHLWFNESKIPVILSVARLSPEKDLQTLVRAFSIVRKERPARLAILGEGSERTKLERLVKELGLENDVWMPGFVDNPFKFMKRAAVFVLSSKFEGAPLVLAEALSVGIPVVSTDCPSGPREILEGGKWGKLVPVGDHEKLAEAILKTIESPPERESLKKRGRNFSIDEIGGKWLKVLGSVTKAEVTESYAAI
ncbi:glycosyltransferase [Fervidibacter sacchari]|uniref:Glycosyltransferase involved in cell wall biosynthesis n=1 Tax=Candidatus Fervidibacter sacchari TaxID=1448929 RepID=A0ABT2EKN9_9BACT|nr:glycosyltransferase [Candidatus Fervidibacter sacchari]MCS3918513.1 glycosyltransferase involved in cell wall biosynthesis [Candidatus Fervidibacter sacchari]WKU17720.1 glycosyltransferase [Candidatus Fervidibacter sacchari]